MWSPIVDKTYWFDRRYQLADAMKHNVTKKALLRMFDRLINEKLTTEKYPQEPGETAAAAPPAGAAGRHGNSTMSAEFPGKVHARRVFTQVFGKNHAIPTVDSTMPGAEDAVFLED